MIQKQNEWDASRWMYNSWSMISHKKISNVIIPGSHNSVTSSLSCDIANDKRGIFLKKCSKVVGDKMTHNIGTQWSKYQPLSVLEQLSIGVRYIDISVGIDTTKKIPESPLRCCLGFFSDEVKFVLQIVRDFCLKNTWEFVILDFRCLNFSSDGDVFEEATNLLLVREIEDTLGSLLVSSQSWHRDLSALHITSQRIFIFYPTKSNYGFWHRDWMIPRDFIDIMQPCNSVMLFMKQRINLFIKVQDERRQQIQTNNTFPRRESLFVLQIDFTQKEKYHVSRIISSALQYISGFHVPLCGIPQNLNADSLTANETILALIENKYHPAFLNVIRLDYIESSQIIQRIVHLNHKPSA